MSSDVKVFQAASTRVTPCRANQRRMALSKTEFRRRLLAALALYGLELKDLPELLAGYTDIPKHHPARMGREGDDLVPGGGTVLALAKELGLPAGWFEDENWAPLVPGAQFQSRAADLGDARQAANAAARARSKSQKRSAGKQTSKEKKAKGR